MPNPQSKNLDICGVPPKLITHGQRGIPEFLDPRFLVPRVISLQNGRTAEVGGIWLGPLSSGWDLYRD